KAHYALLNVECTQEVRDEIENAFRFNDAVIRHMIIKRHKADTQQSPLAKTQKDRKEAEAEGFKDKDEGSVSADKKQEAKPEDEAKPEEAATTEETRPEEAKSPESDEGASADTKDDAAS